MPGALPLVYVDTNVFIYRWETAGPASACAEQVFDAAARGEIRLVSSLLTLAELLVAPIRRGDRMVEAMYRKLFGRMSPILALPLTAGRLRTAAALRAANGGLKLADAIHVASAHDAGCACFVSQDQRMRGALRIPLVGLYGTTIQDILSCLPRP